MIGLCNNYTELTSVSTGYQTNSGRHFYHQYRDALITEEYVMSKMDNCLFYRVIDVETTFIVVFVDDTLIFSKRQEDIDQLLAQLN